MTIKDWRKAFRQLKAKPVKMKKYIKHNAPKVRATGMAKKKCAQCGRYGGHTSKYGLDLCRHCLREIVMKMGFKKYS